MNPYVLITKKVSAALPFIAEGRIVAVPTGTSYALAVDALQGWALQRVRNLKERPADKALTVFMDQSLWSLYLNLEAAEQALLEAMHNRPLTLLVRPKAALSHLAKEGRVGVRTIDHKLMRELAEAAAVPLTATSANRSGHEPGYSLREIEQEFPAITDETTYDLSLAAILDGGTLPPKQPTTVAALSGDEVVIVRQGEITKGDIAAARAGR